MLSDLPWPFRRETILSESQIPIGTSASTVGDPFLEVDARFLLNVPDDCAINESTAVPFAGNTIDEIHGAFRERDVQTSIHENFPFPPFPCLER